MHNLDTEYYVNIDCRMFVYNNRQNNAYMRSLGQQNYVFSLTRLIYLQFVFESNI